MPKYIITTKCSSKKYAETPFTTPPTISSIIPDFKEMVDLKNMHHAYVTFIWVNEEGIKNQCSNCKGNNDINNEKLKEINVDKTKFYSFHSLVQLEQFKNDNKNLPIIAEINIYRLQDNFVYYQFESDLPINLLKIFVDSLRFHSGKHSIKNSSDCLFSMVIE